MIKIIQVLPRLKRGGSQTMVMNLYRNIDRNKYQFDFILFGNDNDAFVDEIKSYGGNIYILPKFNGFNYIKIRKSWINFFREHKEYKILHSHVRSFASIYIPIAKKFGLTTIIHSHSVSEKRNIQFLIKRALEFPLRYQSDYFLACSKEAGLWLFGNKIVNSNKFYVMKNAIDLNKYINSKSKEKEIRKKLNIKDDTSVYTNVGGLSIVKNQLFTVNIFNEIQKKKDNSILFLVGDGPLRDKIELEIKKYKIENKVIITGYVENVEQYLYVSNCFLFPSLYEGLGIAAVEAQATGVYCILNACIPDETNVSNNCDKVSLKNENEWLNKALNYKKKDYDAYKNIKKNGYDIIDTSKWIEKFYESII